MREATGSLGSVACWQVTSRQAPLLSVVLLPLLLKEVTEPGSVRISVLAVGNLGVCSQENARFPLPFLMSPGNVTGLGEPQSAGSGEGWVKGRRSARAAAASLFWSPGGSLSGVPGSLVPGW